MCSCFCSQVCTEIWEFKQMYLFVTFILYWSIILCVGVLWWYFMRDSWFRCVWAGWKVHQSVCEPWRPSYPSCSSAGCVVFVPNCCGATSTSLWCRVWPVCTAASGDATRGAALSRETAAATRSDSHQHRSMQRCFHCGLQVYSPNKVKVFRNWWKLHETWFSNNSI